MMKLELVFTLHFVILNVSWVLDGLLSDVLRVPRLIDVVMAQVRNVAPSAYATHLLADSERALRVGRFPFGLQVLSQSLRGLLS